MTNSVISALLERGYGGSAAVIVPGSDGFHDQLPNSSPPAGVEEVCEVLVNVIKEGANSTASQWVFLLGGAGNGKSHQMASVLEAADLKVPRSGGDARAWRSRWFEERGFSLCVVNDASIRREHNPSDSLLLARDVGQLLKRASVGLAHGLVNINRGILIEELQEMKMKEQPDHGFASKLILWLSGQEPEFDSTLTLDAGYYRQARFESGGQPVTVHAVYLDQLSLLEPMPGQGSGAIKGILSPNPVYEKYDVLPLRDKQRLDSPAGMLLARVALDTKFEAHGCEKCEASTICPYLANFKDLANQEIRLGVLTMLRAAEIISGRLLTYRELWSCIATSLIGPRRAEFSQLHPCEWVMEQARLVEGGEEAKAAHRLVAQRFYLGLFNQQVGSVTSAGDDPSQSNPAAQALALADPVKDVTASKFGVVNDALKSASYAESPLDYLAAKAPETAPCVHAIDRHVLDMPVEQFAGSTGGEVARKRLLFDCGQALYRLYALVNALPAGEETIKTYIELRKGLKEGENAFPLQSVKLQTALKSLLFPPSKLPNFQDYCLLPLFTPRVEPVVSGMEKPTWCYALNLSAQDSIQWRLVPKGDAVWVRLYKGNERIAEFLLDFALCREALTHVFDAEQGCQSSPGFSELGMNVSPRLERIRASVLGQGAGRDISSAPVVVQSSGRVVDLN